VTTPLIGLPEIAEGVANQVPIHNTALRHIEAKLIRALSMIVMAPPAAAEGDSYIIPAGASGAWAGKTGQIAAFIGGAWSYLVPIEGIRLWINDLGAEYVYDGAAWVANGGDASADVDAGIAAHVAASDPHTQYQRESEKGAANGYAGLGSDGKVPAAQLPASATTGGTVTSVGLTTPGVLFAVTGSPITGSGTLAMSLKTQVKNTFLAGPATGGDAAPTMRALTAADLPAQPFDLTAFYPGVPSASAIITRVPVARAVTFPAGLTDSIGRASVAATAQTDFDVRKNGVSVGTMRFAAAATSATFIAASAITLAAGDILSVLAPATPDATLANLGFVLAGTR
jgi:hypothetical protein